MPRTLLTTVALAQANYAVQPGDLAVAPASDVVNGNYFVITGKEVLIAINSDSVAHSFTVLSVPDHLGRSSDLTYSVPANSYAAIEFSVLEGWIQPDGTVYLNPSDTHIKFILLRHQ
jgi:hypothetical protein